MTPPGPVPAGLIPGRRLIPASRGPGSRGPAPRARLSFWAIRAAAVTVGAALTAATDHVVTASGPDPAAPTTVAGRTRSNYRGRSVTLVGGVSAAVGAGVGATVFAPRGSRAPTAVVALSAALAGAYDDLVAPHLELDVDKGWRGHLRALRAGRPSGGVVKVAVIGTGAVVAGRLRARSWAAAVPAAALIAGTANLVNLFDLRPGRAGKVAAVLAASLLSGPAGGSTAAVLGAALAELPGDLGETRMLGDIGANPLGALLGLRLTETGPPARWAVLAVVTALTAASERVSFTRVIARYAPLRAVDEWGRHSGVTPLELTTPAAGPPP